MDSFYKKIKSSEAILTSVILILCWLGGMTSVQAQPVCLNSSANLPPGDCSYRAMEHGKWVLSHPGIVGVEFGPGSAHYGFDATFPPPGPSDPPQTESFGSFLDIQGKVNLTDGTTMPFFLQGIPAAVGIIVTFDSSNGTTTRFSTEMIQLDASFSLMGMNLVLRESPVEPSTGFTQITPASMPGTAYIESYFDIFLDLKIDSDPFVPAENSFRVFATNIPEIDAASGIFLVAGVLALVGERFRSHGSSFRRTH